MTYKILYNDAVAMTGGQPADNGFTVGQISQQLAAEGVRRIVVVTDERAARALSHVLGNRGYTTHAVGDYASATKALGTADFDAMLAAYAARLPKPWLAVGHSMGGCPTALALAKLGIEAGQVGGLGQDLVAMCVNDIICHAARPLFFLDYIGTGKLSKEIAVDDLISDGTSLFDLVEFLGERQFAFVLRHRQGGVSR